MAKVSLSMNRAWFRCPGCDEQHCFVIKAPKNDPDADTWEFNDDVNNPTFSPSLLMQHPKTNATRCHLFVKNGKIEFCPDCPHHLAGKTVEMAEIKAEDI